MQQRIKIENPKKWIFLGLVVVVADQAVKFLIRQSGGFYICNKEAAFGLGIPPFLFWILWSAVVAVILVMIWKNSLKKETGWLFVMLGGAISNFIDRISLGCVVDFINLGFWPAFNLGDLAITIVAVFLLAKYLKIL